MVFEAIGGERTGAIVGRSCGSSIKVCSTRRSPACMMVSTMKQSEPVVVRDVCESGEPCVVFSLPGPARVIRGVRRACIDRSGIEG